MSHSHIQKTLSRRCPECGAQLNQVLRVEKIDGIEYSKSYIECPNCFFEELHRDLTTKGYDKYGH
jgi:uncharacterized protein with PIN domain